MNNWNNKSTSGVCGNKSINKKKWRNEEINEEM